MESVRGFFLCEFVVGVLGLCGCLIGLRVGAVWGFREDLVAIISPESIVISRSCKGGGSMARSELTFCNVGDNCREKKRVTKVRSRRLTNNVQ